MEDTHVESECVAMARKWCEDNLQGADLRTFTKRKNAVNRLRRKHPPIAYKEAVMSVREYASSHPYQEPVSIPSVWADMRHPDMKQPPVAYTTSGKTLEDFRKDHDIKQKIRDGLERLGECYMTDQEFRESCGVSPARWRSHADAPVFDTCRVRVKGVLYWAQPRMIAEMKEIAGIV